MCISKIIRITRFVYPAFLCVILFCCACIPSAEAQQVHCEADPYSPYADVVADVLPPGYVVKAGDFWVLQDVQRGRVVEAFDVQVASVNRLGIDAHWYPHYLTTVVIAMDRDRTASEVQGWRDLLVVDDAVGIMESSLAGRMFFSAIAYGLEGEDYSLEQATQLLTALEQTGRFARNTFDAPIMVCFDYQAVSMLRAGRNLEIIVPTEDTLIYTKGLLSLVPLEIQIDPSPLLYEVGFRLPNGEAEGYPPNASYQSAAYVTDMDHFATLSREAHIVMKREIIKTHIYKAIGSEEDHGDASQY